MDIDVRTQGDTVKLILAGSIDEKGAQELKAHFLRVQEQRPREVVFDFAGVTFIGSAGIGKLLLFYKNISVTGGQIRIENMSREIYTMFKVVKLDKIFQLQVQGGGS